MVSLFFTLKNSRGEISQKPKDTDTHRFRFRIYFTYYSETNNRKTAMFYNRARIQSIKQQTANSREMITIFQQILDQEWPKANTPELRMKLEEIEIDLAKHRQLLDENEALIAKLERPFWKFW